MWPKSPKKKKDSNFKNQIIQDSKLQNEKGDSNQNQTTYKNWSKPPKGKKKIKLKDGSHLWVGSNTVDPPEFEILNGELLLGRPERNTSTPLRALDPELGLEVLLHLCAAFSDGHCSPPSRPLSKALESERQLHCHLLGRETGPWHGPRCPARSTEARESSDPFDLCG